LSLFVHPSLEESFGLALVEAMALGVPVLGGRSSGAVPWVVGKGRTANVRDSDELAGAIVSRLTAKDFLESESLRVYEEARRRFDIEQIARDYLDLLSLVAK
jgi:glycosyltransferase involved in cell wall biosynthesis